MLSFNESKMSSKTVNEDNATTSDEKYAEDETTYQQIIELYQSMNYKVEGRLLIASEYGVPQKRKRVIIIATRNDIDVVPADLFPDKTTVEADKQITAENALKDLENVECSTDSKYDSTYTSPFTKYLLEKYNDIKKG